jgi:polygalacturonase
MRLNIRDYGAQGDGQTLDTSAIQKTIEACAQRGGGTVYIPSGRYVSSSLFMRHNTTLYLEAGATLLGSEDQNDYPIIDSYWEGLACKTHAPLITADGVNHVAITGLGTIDGRGVYWWTRYHSKTLRSPRPRLIGLTRCANVRVEGVTLINSPSWTIHPARCKNVTVDKVTIINPPDSPNTDGINPESCHGVHISNCHIDVGDDCIAIKAGKEDNGREELMPCENITITNCTLERGHGGVVIGSEMSGGVRNVVISNCIFTHTDRGIRMKSRRGRGGVIEDVRVSNLVMTDVLCPFTMNLYYHIGARGNKTVSDKGAQAIGEGTPRLRRIHFSNITARDAHYAAGFLFGLAEAPLEDISFDDVAISMADEPQSGEPDMADDIEPMRGAGFFIRNARGVRLHNLAVTRQRGQALILKEVTDVSIDHQTNPKVDL